METQSGARTPLVDPFGREVEAWLRDAPATRTPYLSDLVVPPVTGPVQRPDVALDAAPEPETDVTPAPAPMTEANSSAQGMQQPHTSDSAFRRPRDRARHAAVCAPSFPEPPERLALRIEDLAVEVSAATGRSTIERIVILEDEIRVRDEDLARLAAWEASVAGSSDPEVEAARAFAHAVFADLLADAALEADRRDRAAARRAATATGSIPVVPRASAAHRSAPTTSTVASIATAPRTVTAPAPAPRTVTSPEAVAATTVERDVAVRPELRLPVVSPVSANTRPTPLIQPATGPTVIDRAAFAAALTAHRGITASTPVVLPEAVAVPQDDELAVSVDATAPAADTSAAPGWWSRLVARVLRALGRP